MGIKIVGCGVSGLSVGIVLLEEGYKVEIITDKLPKETTSSKAAAIWFPYTVNPKEKANKWSKYSYFKFRELCKNQDSGVSMVPLTVLVKKEEEAWWMDAIPENEITKADKEKLPIKYPTGFVLNVPLVETQIYLDFLLETFKKLNGEITIQKVNDLDEFNTEDDIIINCTGLGSRELVNDKSLYPIQGQIVKAESQANIKCIAADFAFGEKADKLAYVVPRKDCLILGGTAIEKEEDIIPKKEITAGIIQRCKEIEPNLQEVKIKSVEVGFRPGRDEIRLENEGNVIHNYGHGGGGFTVSWGCAMDVKYLVKEIISGK